MGLFDLFGKKDVSELTNNSPFKLATEWVPYTLYSGRNSSCTLNVKIRNLTAESLLTSFVVELPQSLGFEKNMLTRQREVRIGAMGPGEEREVGVEVFGSMKSEPGEYTVLLTAMAHYRDYGHVINAVKKRTMLKVV